ncbi:MAG TPA: LysR family transcriptional regulator [Oceanospirillales bacterium]|nr:LysR family transcriptional regulator [Oceanospirillaceae bacterium]HBS42369.1 LysR family transcriptional regulator [Oceanospirillales bacterium]
MDTDLLKTFMEVSRTRHFGRAAENLYLTQSAVSFRVRQLEDILGVELFSRQRNNIQLTPAGEKLMPLAESSVLLEQRIRSEVARADGQTHSLAIGATPNLWDAFLQYELTDLADGESLSLSATAHTGTTLIRQIGERSLDLAFLFDAPKVDDFVTREIHALQLYMVTSGSAQSAEEALDKGYVLVDWGTAFSMQHAQELRTSEPPVLKTNTGRIALDWLLNTGGSAYLPLPMIRPYEASGRLQRVPGAPVIARSVYASYHISRSDDALIGRVLEKVSEHLKRLDNE